MSVSSTATPLSLKPPGITPSGVHAPSPIAESPVREADAMMQDITHAAIIKSLTGPSLEQVEQESSSSLTISKLPEIPNIMTSPLYVEPPVDLSSLIVNPVPVVKPEISAASPDTSPAPGVKLASGSASPTPAAKASSLSSSSVPTKPSSSPAPAGKVSSRSTSPAPAKAASRSSSLSPGRKTTSRSPSPARPAKAVSCSTSPAPSTKPLSQKPSSIPVPKSTSTTVQSTPPLNVRREKFPSTFKFVTSLKVTPSTATTTTSTAQAEALKPPVVRRQSYSNRPISVFVESVPTSEPPPALPSLAPSTTLTASPELIDPVLAPVAQPASLVRPQPKTLLVPRPQSQFITTTSAPPGIGPTLSSSDLIPPIVTIQPATPIMMSRSLEDDDSSYDSDSSSNDDGEPYGLRFRPKVVPPTQPAETSTTTVSDSQSVSTSPPAAPSLPAVKPTVPVAQPSPAFFSSIPSIAIINPTDASPRRPSIISMTSDTEQELDLDALSSRESTPPITPPAQHIEFAPMIQVLDTSDHVVDTTAKQQWPMIDAEKPSIIHAYEARVHSPDKPDSTAHEEDYGDIPNIPSFETPSSLRGSFYSPMTSFPDQRTRNPFGRFGGYADSDESQEEEEKVESPYGPVPPMEDIPIIPSIIDSAEEGGKSKKGPIMLGNHVIGGYAPQAKEGKEGGAEDVEGEGVTGSTDTNLSDVDKSEKDFDPDEMRANVEGVSEDAMNDEEDPFADPMNSTTAWDEHWQSHAYRRRSYSLPQLVHDLTEDDVHDQSLATSNAANSSYTSNPFSSNSNSFGGNSSFNTSNTLYGSNNPFASKSETQLPILHDLNHALLGTPEPAQRLPPPPQLPYSAILNNDVLSHSSSSNDLNGSTAAPGVGVIAAGSDTALPMTTSSVVESGGESEIKSPHSPPTLPVFPGAYSSPTVPTFSSAPPEVKQVQVAAPLPIRTFTPPPSDARAFTPPPARTFTPPPTIPRPSSLLARMYAHGQFVDPTLKRKDDREQSGALVWDPLGSNTNATMGHKKSSPPTLPVALPIPFPEIASSTYVTDPLTDHATDNDCDRDLDLEKGPGLSPAYSDDIDADGDIEGEEEGYVRVGTGNMSPFDPITIGAFSSGYGPLVGSSSPVMGAKSEEEKEGEGKEVRLTSAEIARGDEGNGASSKDDVQNVGVAVKERERDMRNPFDSVERLASTSSITLLNPGAIPLTSTFAGGAASTSGFEQKHPGESTMSLGSNSGLVDSNPHPNTETRGSRTSGQFNELSMQQAPNANANGQDGDPDYTRWTVIGVVGTLAGVVTTGLLLGLRRIGVGISDDRVGPAGARGRQREPQFAALDISSMRRSASTGWMEVGSRGRQFISESMVASTSSTIAAAQTKSRSSPNKNLQRSPTQVTQPLPSLGMTAPALGMRRAHSHIPIRSDGQHHPTKMALFLDILHSGPGVLGGLIFGGGASNSRTASTANVGLNPTLQPSSSSGCTMGKDVANVNVGLGMIRQTDSDQNSSSGLIMHVDDGDERENGGVKGDGVGGSLKAGVLYVRDTVVWAFGRVSGWGVTR